MIRRAASILGICIAVAACSSGSAPGGEAVDGVLSIEGTDRLEFLPSDVTAETGDLVIELTCTGAAPHTFVIDETDELVVECEGGETNSGEVALEPGDYTFFCSVPGHRSGGMVGTLTVSG